LFGGGTDGWVAENSKTFDDFLATLFCVCRKGFFIGDVNVRAWP
jgi:hypothetical protein